MVFGAALGENHFSVVLDLFSVYGHCDRSGVFDIREWRSIFLLELGETGRSRRRSASCPQAPGLSQLFSLIYRASDAGGDGRREDHGEADDERQASQHCAASEFKPEPERRFDFYFRLPVLHGLIAPTSAARPNYSPQMIPITLYMY